MGCLALKNSQEKINQTNNHTKENSSFIEWFRNIPVMRVIKNTYKSVRSILKQNVIKAEQVIEADAPLSLDEFIKTYEVWETYKYKTVSKKTGEEVEYEYTISKIVWWMVSGTAYNPLTKIKTHIRWSFSSLAPKMSELNKSNVVDINDRISKSKKLANTTNDNSPLRPEVNNILNKVRTQWDPRIISKVRNQFKPLWDVEKKVLLKTSSRSLEYIGWLLEKLELPREQIYNGSIINEWQYLNPINIHKPFRDFYMDIFRFHEWQKKIIMLNEYFICYKKFLLERKEYIELEMVKARIRNHKDPENINIIQYKKEKKWPEKSNNSNRSKYKTIYEWNVYPIDYIMWERFNTSGDSYRSSLEDSIVSHQ